MTDSNRTLTNGTINSNYSSDSASSEDSTFPSGNGLPKIAIGALIGAVLGGLAVALTNQETAEQISRSIRGLGKTVKATAENVNDAVQNVGDAVNGVAVAVNDTNKDVNDAVNGVATKLGSTVKESITTVQDTAKGVKETAKTTANVVNTVKSSVNSIQEVAQQTDNAPIDVSTEVSKGETLYKLIPVSQDQSAK